MKTKITIAFIILFIGAFLAAHSQALFTGTLTNAQTVETISNGVIIASEPLSPPAPTIVAPNGQVVPQAFIDALAQAYGVPTELVKAIPLKYLFWMAFLYVISQPLARDLRKGLPDKWQTGVFGLVLKHIAREINPKLTPTPPDAGAPKVELKDVQTGATVAPQAVSQSTTKL